MSLMNDALRKKKNEKKHPPGPEFLKNDSEKKSKNKVRLYGIAAIVLLVCATASYYLYEMMSLSRPMVPAQQSPLLAEPRVSPPEEVISSVQKPALLVSSKTEIPADLVPDKQVAPPQPTTVKSPLPVPEPEAEIVTLEGTPQKTVNFW